MINPLFVPTKSRLSQHDYCLALIQEKIKHTFVLRQKHYSTKEFYNTAPEGNVYKSLNKYNNRFEILNR